MAEGICSGEWKELDDLGYEERRRVEERSDERLGKGGRPTVGAILHQLSATCFCDLNAALDCTIYSRYGTNLYII